MPIRLLVISKAGDKAVEVTMDTIMEAGMVGLRAQGTAPRQVTDFIIQTIIQVDKEILMIELTDLEAEDQQAHKSYKAEGTPTPLKQFSSGEWSITSTQPEKIASELLIQSEYYYKQIFFLITITKTNLY